jgi:rare lipoprotein A (peptidoglycan hydrolase)
VLDLSLEAARRLDMVRKGSAKVMIEIVKTGQ